MGFAQMSKGVTLDHVAVSRVFMVEAELFKYWHLHSHKFLWLLLHKNAHTHTLPSLSLAKTNITLYPTLQDLYRQTTILQHCTLQLFKDISCVIIMCTLWNSHPKSQTNDMTEVGRLKKTKVAWQFVLWKKPTISSLTIIIPGTFTDIWTSCRAHKSVPVLATCIHTRGRHTVGGYKLI